MWFADDGVYLTKGLNEKTVVVVGAFLKAGVTVAILLVPL